MLRPITFIIPCAGKGTRLSVPMSKELFPINHDRTLIDCVFSNLKIFRYISQVVIIISKEKMELVKYLSKYSDYFKIYFIYQDSQKENLMGAIQSVEELFSKKNILILPDILLFDNNIHYKLEKYIDMLDDEINLAILDYYENDVNKRKKLGNIEYNNDEIISIIDKPSDDSIIAYSLKYCWVSIGFTYKNLQTFYQFFQRIQMKNEKFDLDCHNIIAKSIHIDNALDMGVWENVKFYYNMEENK